MTDLAALITAPLPGDNPVGTDVSFDPDFERMKSEIGKLGGLDHDVIRQCAVQITTGKAKDLRVFAFWSYTQLRDQNWKAFADVIEGITHFTENHFDAVYPTRIRAKENAFRWLSEERYNAALSDARVAPDDHPQVQRLVDTLTRLRCVLDARFPDGAPFPARLLAKAMEWAGATEPRTDPQSAQPQTGRQTQQASAQEPLETPRQAQTLARKAALFLIDKEPTKPMGYRLLRAIRWDMLEMTPPADQGRTQIHGPASELRAALSALMQKAEWDKVGPAAEKAFSAGGNHCWLDLQRMAVLACGERGSVWDNVREAIERESAALIARIPDLTALAFADGTPFCDDTTRDWLSQLCRGKGDGNQAPSAREAATEDPVCEEKRGADRLASSGRVNEALALVQQTMSSSANERDRFRRALLLCSLLLGVRRIEMALGILEGLEAKAESHRLDTWDPELAVQAWRMTYEACGYAAETATPQIQSSMRNRQQELLRRISRVDPKTAFSLSI